MDRCADEVLYKGEQQKRITSLIPMDVMSHVDLAPI